MSPETKYETQHIDHLGIITGISREIGLVETIDEKVGKTDRKVSCGEAVLAIVPNALGFSSRALHLTLDYLGNKPVDLLIRPGLVAEDFNGEWILAESPTGLESRGGADHHQPKTEPSGVVRSAKWEQH